jgi:hypothetical protein
MSLACVLWYECKTPTDYPAVISILESDTTTISMYTFEFPVIIGGCYKSVEPYNSQMCKYTKTILTSEATEMRVHTYNLLNENVAVIGEIIEINNTTVGIGICEQYYPSKSVKLVICRNYVSTIEHVLPVYDEISQITEPYLDEARFSHFKQNQVIVIQPFNVHVTISHTLSFVSAYKIFPIDVNVMSLFDILPTDHRKYDVGNVYRTTAKSTHVNNILFDNAAYRRFHQFDNQDEVVLDDGSTPGPRFYIATHVRTHWTAYPGNEYPTYTRTYREEKEPDTPSYAMWYYTQHAIICDKCHTVQVVTEANSEDPLCGICNKPRIILTAKNVNFPFKRTCVMFKEPHLEQWIHLFLVHPAQQNILGRSVNTFFYAVDTSQGALAAAYMIHSELGTKYVRSRVYIERTLLRYHLVNDPELTYDAESEYLGSPVQLDWRIIIAQPQ